MQGGLPVSGLFLAFSISTRLSGTVHIAATEEKGEMKGRLQVPSFHPAPRPADKHPAAACPIQQKALPQECCPWPQLSVSGSPSHRFFCNWSWGQPGQQNSTSPQGSCMYFKFENHYSTGFLHDLPPTQPVLRSYGACYG